MTQIETDIFKIPAATYMQRLFHRYLISRWYVFVAIIILFFALSFIDLRFIYVLLMVVFIVIPSLLGFVYFYYAFSEECVTSIRNGKIRMTDDGIERIFYNDDKEIVGKKLYGWTAFASVERYKNYLIIEFSEKKFGFIMIPKNVVEDIYSAKKFILSKL